VSAPGQGAPPPGASRCVLRTHSFPPRPPGYVLSRTTSVVPDEHVLEGDRESRLTTVCAAE